MSDFLMPALSPTMEEGKLAKWHVRVGDHIAPGQLIAEIETDKATMEVEAVDEGVIDQLLVAEGAEGVPVNTPIARLLAVGAAPAKVEVAAPAPAEAKAEPVAAQPSPKVVSAAEAASAIPAFSPKATPLANRIAGMAGLALGGLAGSGPHGRILKQDVEAALGLLRPSSAPSVAAPETAPQPRPSLEAMGIAPGSYDLVPLDGMRRTIARRMSDSFRDVPHFPLTVDVEIDALLALRERVNAALAPEGVKASLNDMVIKLAAVALRRMPAANASYTPEGIALHRHADIAMAVAIDGGLITPIIRRAETKGLGQIARESKDLAQRARAKKLAPEEYQGGTFSVSNLGMFGIRSFASILNEPQGAILSVGAGEKRPVVKAGELAIATVMTVTMTCDHRAMDGATAAGWLNLFKEIAEQPLKLLL